MHWITIEKDHKIIEFILYEQWKSNKDICHIRQIAILPDEQRKVYGAGIIKSILTFDNNIKKIITDTKRIGVKQLIFIRETDLKPMRHLAIVS
jgi:N-acetylglutamate synthase-like GNAT family acetyltransferase